MLSYFGFIHPSKGFEQVLDVLKVLRNQGIPAKLIVLGELSNANPYHQRLLALIAQKPFADSVKVVGHLNRNEVANCLAMSDACVLPFVDGIHPKRGSFLAAVQQGVLTVTTSVERSGLFLDENVFYAKPGDIEEMAKAVYRYSARKVPVDAHPRRTWGSVADEHLEFFNQLLVGEKAEFSLQAARDTNACR